MASTLELRVRQRAEFPRASAAASGGAQIVLPADTAPRLLLPARDAHAYCVVTL
jgi:hypothetical protein